MVSKNSVSTSASTGSAKLKSEIEKAAQEWANALKIGNIEKLVNLYTEDAKIMGSGHPSFTGKENIIKSLDGFIRDKITGSDFTTLDVWGNDEYCTEEGIGTFSHEDGKVVSRGKYLLVWKKVDGKWKIFRDMYNSDGAL
jgi:uncharacterized protein (TIGR02246 family)